MPLVFVIEGKVSPCIERSIFFHSRYDKTKVVNDGFIFYVQYTSASFLMVSPRCEKFDGKIFIRVAGHFADKG